LRSKCDDAPVLFVEIGPLSLYYFPDSWSWGEGAGEDLKGEAGEKKNKKTEGEVLQMCGKERRLRTLASASRGWLQCFMRPPLFFCNYLHSEVHKVQKRVVGVFAPLMYLRVVQKYQQRTDVLRTLLLGRYLAPRCQERLQAIRAKQS
jgi:hypothetical protein